MDGSRRRSRKRSAASLSSPPDPSLHFFIDASLGRTIVPGLLRAAGASVTIHDDLFPQGTPDVVWLTDVGKRGWLVLTKDKRIRYRAIEQRALVRARVGAFVVTGKDMSGEEIGTTLVIALPRLVRFANATSRPFIASVTAAGTITRVR